MIRTEFLENPAQISSILFQKLSENNKESNVEMLSNVQIIKKQSKIESSNENTCEKPLEPHSIFYTNPTTTQTMWM